MSTLSINSLTDNASQLLELARIAETIKAFEDMCHFMKKLILIKTSNKKELDVEERHLFFASYTNVYHDKKSSLKTLKAVDETSIDGELLNRYISLIENEMESLCKEVIELLTQYICKHNIYTIVQINLIFRGYIRTMIHCKIPNDIVILMQTFFYPIHGDIEENDCDEMEVWTLKQCGDYYKYLANIKPNIYRFCAKPYYVKASKVAQVCLNDDHPTKLNLAVNFSEYYYEILKEPETAIDSAFNAFNRGLIATESSYSYGSYKNTDLFLQKLGNNMELWVKDDEDLKNRLEELKKTIN